MCVSCSIQDEATGDSVDDRGGRDARRSSRVARSGRSIGGDDDGRRAEADAEAFRKGGARTSIGSDFRFDSIWIILDLRRFDPIRFERIVRERTRRWVRWG